MSWRRTALGVFVAVLALLVSSALVGVLGVDVGVSGAESPFAVAPLAMSAVVAGVGAAVVYAALVRATERPVRNFLAVSGVVFAAMLVPVVAFAPTLGVNAVGQVVLVAFHAVAAVPIVGFRR